MGRASYAACRGEISGETWSLHAFVVPDAPSTRVGNLRSQRRLEGDFSGLARRARAGAGSATTRPPNRWADASAAAPSSRFTTFEASRSLRAMPTNSCSVPSSPASFSRRASGRSPTTLMSIDPSEPAAIAAWCALRSAMPEKQCQRRARRQKRKFIEQNAIWGANLRLQTETCSICAFQDENPRVLPGLW
jgi:hypothetical protein